MGRKSLYADNGDQFLSQTLTHDSGSV